MLEPPNGLTLDPETLRALAQATHSDPFSVLGPHETARGRVVRVYAPGASEVTLLPADGGTPVVLEQRQADGFFSGLFSGERYRLRMETTQGTCESNDPYSFGLLLPPADLSAISNGTHRRLDQCLGAHLAVVDGVSGIRFAVWAPNARRAAVIGDFNGWDARRHGMRLRHEAGVWEIFIPDLGAGERYKFEILGCDGIRREKADPFARRTELPPATASITTLPLVHEWRDQEWLAQRRERQKHDEPISIYEVHAGSWMHPREGTNIWQTAIDRLVPYAASLGFTHIELLPVAEHPFAGSWGYQPLSQFAPTSRYGSREDFARFVDACHRAGIGVIVDWVPAHFPDDAHGLVCFDGTELFEHSDSLMKRHPDWGTFNYDHGRNEVRAYLFASAFHWLEEFHVDGLRVDAVASMLYRDYSRENGQWSRNVHGGRENLEAISFFRDLNALVMERCPGVITIAEESTSWPHVTGEQKDGGLGFSFKWNMGWMNDTLRYMARDPIYRRWHHDEITFVMMYAWSEKFVLPLSHDEVVHEKCSILSKMHGDDWQKRSSLRAVYAMMWTLPGKKLLFMGSEFGQQVEWNHDGQLDWWLLDGPEHRGLQTLVRDLNRIYRHERALAGTDADPQGFQWIVVDDKDRSVFVFERRTATGDSLIVAINMTPVTHESYRIGAPSRGYWHEILNTDAAVYGGAGRGNRGGKFAEPIAAQAHPQSITIVLPELSAVVFRHEAE
jgi:1,4-alpha-glucan branching enzyme